MHTTLLASFLFLSLMLLAAVAPNMPGKAMPAEQGAVIGASDMTDTNRGKSE